MSSNPPITTSKSWESPEWDYFSRTLSLELENSNVLQAFLWKDNTLLEYGLPLLAANRVEAKIKSGHRKMFHEYVSKRMVFSGSFTKDNQEYNTFSSVHSAGRANIVFLMVIKKQRNLRDESWKRISQLLESFGFAFPGGEKRLISLYSDFSQHFLEQIQSKIQKCEFGVITHFYIQDLEKYFQAMGLQKSFEILKSIQSIIGSNIKSEDLFVHQGTRTYFIFSPKCEKEVVLKRFEEVFLQIHHLIVDYRMRFLEIKKDSNIQSEWDKFILNVENPSTS
ncbi:MAG: hypothetical protein JJT78_15990 [Leptospira sp.]|nr:hypothetical protein [Leptospira sp.]